MPIEQLTQLGKIRPIVRWAAPVMHIRAQPVTDFGTDLQSLLADMFATNTAAHGAGLAAPQIETDHLHGTVFADRLPSRPRRDLYRSHEENAHRYPPDWPVSHQTS